MGQTPKVWKVVGQARNSPEESISQESASIRVVMDLPSSQKLYPTAYTPGFPTLPCNHKPDSSGSGSRVVKEPTEEKEEEKLPPGYSVALDVHILEDARIMLDFQRSFRGGEIDPKYKWLDEIVSRTNMEGGIGMHSNEDVLALTDGNTRNRALELRKAPEV